jgi:hypothetical protein
MSFEIGIGFGERSLRHAMGVVARERAVLSVVQVLREALELNSAARIGLQHLDGQVPPPSGSLSQVPIPSSFPGLGGPDLALVTPWHGSVYRSSGARRFPAWTLAGAR